MSQPPRLLIDRCSFWPEARNPEAWLRSLAALSIAAKSGTRSWTSPRTIGETVLRGHLSRRGVPGLFGLDSPKGSEPSVVLHGVGLLTQNADTTWQLSTDALALLGAWQSGDHRQALEQLAAYLLRRSAWLRLAILKVQSGAWVLVHWHKLKAGNGQLRVGQTLLLGNDTASDAWLSGIEQAALGDWWLQLGAETQASVEIHAPKTAKADDGLSLSPLKSPLYLLDSLGWLDVAGRLKLPASLASESAFTCLVGGQVAATAHMNQAVAAFSDHRGVFPLEPVMLRFAEAIGVFPDSTAHDTAFIAWTDRLLSEAFRTGVIELLSAEPGQSRHGRGLLGDVSKKLLSWRVHDGFDALSAGMASNFNQTSNGLHL